MSFLLAWLAYVQKWTIYIGLYTKVASEGLGPTQVHPPTAFQQCHFWSFLVERMPSAVTGCGHDLMVVIVLWSGPFNMRGLPLQNRPPNKWCWWDAVRTYQPHSCYMEDTMNETYPSRSYKSQSLVVVLGEYHLSPQLPRECGLLFRIALTLTCP